MILDQLSVYDQSFEMGPVGGRSGALPTDAVPQSSPGASPKKTSVITSGQPYHDEFLSHPMSAEDLKRADTLLMDRKHKQDVPVSPHGLVHSGHLEPSGQ